MGGVSMTRCAFSISSTLRTYPLLQFRLWHIVILVAYVAIAIVDIKDNRRTEPALVALAAIGFVAYALICWLMWHGLRRLVRRIGAMPALIVYLVAMAGLFFAATVVYLVLEYAYLMGYRLRLGHFFL
jgi:hypothetical protein